MQPLELDPEMRALLETDGITHVMEVRSLDAEEVGRLLQSTDEIRCILTSGIHKNPRWLAPQERRDLWQQEIRPRMLNPSWEGSYEASEWRTDQNELIIVFLHSYVPI